MPGARVLHDNLRGGVFDHKRIAAYPRVAKLDQLAAARHANLLGRCASFAQFPLSAFDLVEHRKRSTTAERRGCDSQGPGYRQQKAWLDLAHIKSGPERA